MKITNNIKEILEQGTFKENIYLLPDIDLGKDYKNVNKVLMSLGGKWKTRVWHVFSWTQEELESALFEVLEKWETVTLDEIKKQFQYFPTPKELAKELVELAIWDSCEVFTVLEPSAWQGAIVIEIEDIHKLTCIELMKDNFEELEESIMEENCEFINMDFMEYNEKKFQRIIANPPFSKNQDVKHILHMYELLEKWGRIVSIASSGIQHKETKLHEQLRALNPEFIEVPEGAFKESWTMVNTVIVVINK